MRKFDTKVQYLKYKILREVAREAWADNLYEKAIDIPKTIVPGKTSTMRCCVYKERAILAENVKLAMGGNKDAENVIEVIDIACDDCPMGGYDVTPNCRGCVFHRCEDVCKKGAINFDHSHIAHIDKSKCVECGACAKACPYSAIHNFKRPCESSCKVKCITRNPETNSAKIDQSKCVSCGACVYHCPFGAIVDKSFLLDVIALLKKSEENRKYKTYALVAPSIVSQFIYAKPGQFISGIKKLGFSSVVETALGADIVAKNEAKELSEKGFLLSSCCPAFVEYVELNFPSLAPSISKNPSPMTAIARELKADDPNCKIVFIGPCTAKKAEAKKVGVKEYIDSVITFEELQALFDSKDIDINELPEDALDNASSFGRKFARSGGVAAAVAQGLKEQGLNFDFNPVSCDGIEACRMALLKKSKNALDANFIEGMACLGGCVGGAGCLTHSDRNAVEVDKHGLEAGDKTITEAVEALHYKNH